MSSQMPIASEFSNARPDVAEGSLLWTPAQERIEASGIFKFMAWLASSKGKTFATYGELWAWSVAERESFWRALWDYFDVIHDGSFERACSDEDIFEARWFDGAHLNYAEHLLRHETVAGEHEVAICHSTEIRPVCEMTWQVLGSKVRILATRLRELGVKPGDRIVAYMPNVAEAAVAMLATTAIGAVWSSAAPEFGARTVIERFSQIEPKVAFVADGYSFNGTQFDRRDEIATIADALPSLERIIILSYLGLEPELKTRLPVSHFEELLEGEQIDPQDFRFERVPASHPLWVLFSSGTTGVPKAIVHPHGGIVVEHLKVMSFHCDLRPGKRMFFYTTTGWMMWNSVMSALIAGACAVLYDGSPVYGGAGMLWSMAERCGATLFGASPTLVQSMKKAGVVPKNEYDLSALDTVIVGGAPSTPATFQWFYENVADDIWVTSQSGGTEVCTGLAVGVPILPIYAAEIQARGLGIDLHVWDDAGDAVIDQVGELVVTSPMPSAPLTFWGENGRQRYHDSYFADFLGVWRHGDLAKLNSRGGVYVYGRSDSTLNRFGVRIGTAEVYRVLEQVPGIVDSLVICCETPEGGFYMPLFVALEPGRSLDDEMKRQIVSKLRADASPRHVPDEIHQAPAIPYTLTGKKMEVPIRKIVSGASPEKAASRDAMAAPELLSWYIDFAHRPDVVAKR